MSMKLRGKYEDHTPRTHTRVETDVWDMDCIYGECGHDDNPDAERPFEKCPSSKAIVCEECSEWNSEVEGGVEPWPCENQAVQEWQAAGRKERRYNAMVEAFLRGWREHERRDRLHKAMTTSSGQELG
jgi:hypothetical protein